MPHHGQQSGKSSNKWFTSGGRRVGHEKGYGASAGDGRTSDKSILGKIVPVFKKKGES